MIAPRLLRTRVARRILALFLLCAMLPVASFAVVGYSVVAKRLEKDAREQLRQGSKTAGMMLFARLGMLSSQLAALNGTRHAGDSSAVFGNVFLERGDGEVTVIQGRPIPVPMLTPRQRAQLRRGAPVLLTASHSGAATLVLVVESQDSNGSATRLWGTAPAEVLLGTGEGQSPALLGTDLCVLDSEGRLVTCPSGEAASATRAMDLNLGQPPGWQRGDSLFLMGRWSLFLGNGFSSPSWTVALSMPSDAIYAPLSAFRRASLLAVALAGLLVFLLSHAQLRRQMTPLAELESGVRRISGGDFSIPVVIGSHDEFEMLANSFNGMAGDLQARMGELHAFSEGAMLALARTIDANSPWTAGHSERVTSGALEIGRRLALDAESLDQLRRGGLLHDIGKIAVPAAILDKPGPLTEAERSVIQSHPTVGAEIILPIAAFGDIIPLIRYHHELLDGSGYPEGLSGEAIPELVRILTVADIFDALTSDRPYRRGFTPQKALTMLRDGAGRRFDARAVEGLAAALAEGWFAVVVERRPIPPRADSILLEMAS